MFESSSLDYVKVHFKELHPKILFYNPFRYNKGRPMRVDSGNEGLHESAHKCVQLYGRLVKEKRTLALSGVNREGEAPPLGPTPLHFAKLVQPIGSIQFVKSVTSLLSSSKNVSVWFFMMSLQNWLWMYLI